MSVLYCKGNFLSAFFISVLKSKCLMMSQNKLNKFYQPWVDVTVGTCQWECNINDLKLQILSSNLVSSSFLRGY